MAFNIDNNSFFNDGSSFEPKELRIKDNVDVAGGAISGVIGGAASGASAGIPGMIAGAGIGLVTSIIGSNSQKKAIAKQNSAIENRNLIKDNRRGAIVRNTLPKLEKLPFGG